MSVCLFVRRLWGGWLTASQPFNHAFTSFGTITALHATVKVLQFEYKFTPLHVKVGHVRRASGNRV